MMAHFVCLSLVLGLLYSVFCHRGVFGIATKVCDLKVTFHLPDKVWKRVTNPSGLQELDIHSYKVCCDSYVFKGTPKCDPGCPSGSCIHGYCPPDEEKANCKCYYNRFYPFSDYHCSTPVCQPSQDSKCTCHSGYTKDSRTNLCVPTECYNRCTNGNCDQLGTCVFCNHTNMNHITQSNGICLMKDCVHNCVNGQCNKIGVCECHEGFKNVNNLTCTQIVCPSFYHEDILFCKEDCNSKCTDGTCSDDGTCICKTGHKANPEDRFKCQKIRNCPSFDSKDDSFCKSECLLKCMNGECSDAGSCKCKFGFYADLTNIYNCLFIACPSSTELGKAFCKEECINKCNFGICNNQSECICSRDYSKLSSPFTCVPQCTAGCGSNALCTGPDLCTCATGYIEIAFSGNCVQKCIKRGDCSNGSCSYNDGKCSCDAGYHLDVTNTCVPLCISECANGNCTGFNECSCNEGFVEVDGSCVEDCSALGVCNLAWIGVGAAVATLLVVASVVGGLVAWRIAKGRRKRSMSLEGCAQDNYFGIELQQ